MVSSISWADKHHQRMPVKFETKAENRDLGLTPQLVAEGVRWGTAHLEDAKLPTDRFDYVNLMNSPFPNNKGVLATLVDNNDKENNLHFIAGESSNSKNKNEKIALLNVFELMAKDIRANHQGSLNVVA